MFDGYTMRYGGSWRWEQTAQIPLAQTSFRLTLGVLNGENNNEPCAEVRDSFQVLWLGWTSHLSLSLSPLSAWSFTEDKSMSYLQRGFPQSSDCARVMGKGGKEYLYSRGKEQRGFEPQDTCICHLSNCLKECIFIYLFLTLSLGMEFFWPFFFFFGGGKLQ